MSRFFQDPGLEPQDDIGFPFLHPEHNNQARRPGRGIAQVSSLLSRGLISDRNPSKEEGVSKDVITSSSEIGTAPPRRVGGWIPLMPVRMGSRSVLPWGEPESWLSMQGWGVALGM